MRRSLAICIFVLLFGVYALTTSPYLQAGDSAEMTAAIITLGVPHQPSYPLYVVISHAISTIPFPYLPQYLSTVLPQYNLSLNKTQSIILYRIGLTSALFQAFAGVYIFLLLIEIEKLLHKTHKLKTISTIPLFIALLVTLSYSFSETIWLYGTKPEVFALNNLFATTILYYAFRWYNQSSTGKISASYFLLLGVAFSHHQTIVLVFPVLLLIYFSKKSILENGSALHILNRWLHYPFDRKFNKSFPYFFCFSVALIPFFIILFLLAQRYPFMNWGEISGPTALLKALIRADYGSIGAYLTNVKNNTVAVDQIPFFAKQLVIDYSLFLLFLAIIGSIILYRKNRRISAAITTLFVLAGPLFLMYANFALDSDFSKATVVRFYMLPEIAVVIWIFIFLSTIYQKINELNSQDREGAQYRTIGTVIFFLVTVALIAQSIYKNKPVFDNLTYQFAKTAIEQTEDNALILITGDIPNMTMQYMQAVEGQKKNRIIFSPGQFHLAWLRRQLRERYPSLKIPAPLPGKQFTSPSQVIDANFGKQPIYIVTDFVDIDPLIQQKYVLWPKNLLLKVEKQGIEYKLEPYLEENKKLFNSLDLNEFEQLRNKKAQLESPLVFYYSRHFYNLGAVFNSVHKYGEAIEQFQRALTLDPTLADAYKALGNLYYFTEDYKPKNPELALQYLNRYLETTNGSSVDQIIAVQDAIKKINADIKKVVEEQDKAQQEVNKKQNEATSSAESSASAQIKNATDAATPQL